jgi:hypothetical protein
MHFDQGVGSLQNHIVQRFEQIDGCDERPDLIVVVTEGRTESAPKDSEEQRQLHLGHFSLCAGPILVGSSQTPRRYASCYNGHQSRHS